MKKNLKISFALLYVLVDVVSEIAALRCYSCSLTPSTSDMRCLHNPATAEGQSIVSCSKKYCTIQRQELKDPPGKINSFVRGCEEKPILLDDVLDDSMFRTFYRSCTTDLCNDGDGTKSSTQDTHISPDSYEGENLVLPGMPFDESSGSNLQPKLMILYLGLIFYISSIFKWNVN